MQMNLHGALICTLEIPHSSNGIVKHGKYGSPKYTLFSTKF